MDETNRYVELTTDDSLSGTTKTSNQENYIGPEDAMTVVMLTVGSLGVLGNAFVLIVLLGTKRLRQMLPNLLIINQSLIDLTAGLLLMIQTATRFELGYDLRPKGIAAELYCKFGFGMIVVWGTMKASTYNLIAITIERYLMVVFPLKHKVAFTRNKALGMAVSAWLIGLTWEMTTSMPFSKISDGVCAYITDEAWEEPYGFLTIIISFFIPLVIHPTLYAHMVVVLRKAKKKVLFPPSCTGIAQLVSSSGTSGIKTRNPKLTLAQKNLFKTMAFVTIGFFLCWSWNQLYFFFYNIGLVLNSDSSFYFFTVAASNFNCCVNPVLYLLMYRDFGKAARKIFSRGAQVEPAS